MARKTVWTAKTPTSCFADYGDDNVGFGGKGRQNNLCLQCFFLQFFLDIYRCFSVGDLVKHRSFWPLCGTGSCLSRGWASDGPNARGNAVVVPAWIWVGDVDVRSGFHHRAADLSARLPSAITSGPGDCE